MLDRVVPAALRYRLGPILAVIAILVLGPAVPADAHFAGGPQPSNFTGRVTDVTPEVTGLTVRVVDNGDRLEIVNTTDTPVIVYGYDHDEGTDNDPYLKVSADGVWVNQNSTAAYLNLTLFGSGTVPDSASADAEPSWTKEREGGSYRWHDHRTHWMSQTDPPRVQGDPTRTHVVIEDWKVFLAYGDQPVTATGSLVWNPPPVTWPYWTAVVLLAAAAVGATLLKSWPKPVLAMTGLLVVGDLVHLATSPFPDDPTQGNLAFAIAAAALPSAVVLLLAFATYRSVRSGSSSVPFPLGIIGVMVAIQGMSDAAVLWNSHIPQTGPDWLARIAVVITLGVGVGLAIAAVVLRRRLPVVSHRPPSEESLPAATTG